VRCFTVGTPPRLDRRRRRLPSGFCSMSATQGNSLYAEACRDSGPGPVDSGVQHRRRQSAAGAAGGVGDRHVCFGGGRSGLSRAGGPHRRAGPRRTGRRHRMGPLVIVG
jgi:hypothetical protein